MARPSDDEIRTLSARVSQTVERILKALCPAERYMGGSVLGGSAESTWSPIGTNRDGAPQVTFCAYSGHATAFYGWNPDLSLPLTPEELGAALAGVLIGEGAHKTQDGNPWFQTRTAGSTGPGAIGEETIARAIEAAKGADAQ